MGCRNRTFAQRLDGLRAPLGDVPRRLQRDAHSQAPRSGVVYEPDLAPDPCFGEPSPPLLSSVPRDPDGPLQVHRYLLLDSSSGTLLKA